MLAYSVVILALVSFAVISYGKQEDNHEQPKYIFNYAVHDPHTEDQKQHIEERHGDKVIGIYTLKEADGTMRIVEYKADKHHGFQAVVHKLGDPKQEERYSIGGNKH